MEPFQNCGISIRRLAQKHASLPSLYHEHNFEFTECFREGLVFLRVTAFRHCSAFERPVETERTSCCPLDSPWLLSTFVLKLKYGKSNPRLCFSYCIATNPLRHRTKQAAYRWLEPLFSSQLLEQGFVPLCSHEWSEQSESFWDKYIMSELQRGLMPRWCVAASSAVG